MREKQLRERVTERERPRERVTERERPRERERATDRESERVRITGRGREIWRDNRRRYVTEHSLRRGSKSRQRRHGDMNRRNLFDTANRTRNRDQWEHKHDEKDASYGNMEGWTTVVNRRKANERKKSTLEERLSYKCDTWGNPPNYHHNWRNKEDITSYYFTHFTDEVNEVRLWEKFKLWGDVREVYIAKRRNKDGRRYGFVRFKGVSDIKHLEIKLDNIFIDNQKLFVNLPRFARSVWKLEAQPKVGKGGVSDKDTIRSPQDNSRPRQRSYAEVAAQGGASAGTTSCEGETPVITITLHEGHDYWCKGAWVGRLKKHTAMELLEDHISWELGYNISTKFLGDDMILLTGLSEDKAQQIIRTEVDGGNSLFYSFEKWRPECRPNNRVVWIQLWGFPVEAWDVDHMKKAISVIGDVIEPDEDTDDRRRLDRARLLVRTPLPPAITKEITVRTGDVDHKVWMVEEIGEDAGVRSKRTHSSVG